MVFLLYVLFFTVDDNPYYEPVVECFFESSKSELYAFTFAPNLSSDDSFEIDLDDLFSYLFFSSPECWLSS